MNPLRRYWFVFETFNNPTPLNLGCGVTAYDYEDAIDLLRKCVFFNDTFPNIDKCFEDVDVSMLDQKHVLPNMGLVVVRGVWFPRGYELALRSHL